MNCPIAGLRFQLHLSNILEKGEKEHSIKKPQFSGT